MSERSGAGYIGAEPLCTFSLVRFFDVCQRNEHITTKERIALFAQTPGIPRKGMLASFGSLLCRLTKK
jgi:hypothetical protein